MKNLITAVAVYLFGAGFASGITLELISLPNPSCHGGGNFPG
jgi:hypothetical protein